ncbi:DnaJ domain-containing protein [Flammeovirga sp. MY04]|nr:DnaJ domain-containing protein [Flammeovirga sp. MY04]
MMSSYYEILGISRSSSKKEIKAAYKKLAKKYHPDTNKTDSNSSEKFKEIAFAYEYLMNDYQRQMYDQWLKYQEDLKSTTTNYESEDIMWEDKSKFYENFKSNREIQKEDDKRIFKWGSIAVVFMVIGLNVLFYGGKYYQEKVYKEELNNEIKAIENVLKYTEEGHYGKALIEAKQMEKTLHILTHQRDVLYDSLLKEVDIASLYFFQERSFDEVVSLLSEVEEEVGMSMPNELYWRLAVAQFNTKRYHQSTYTFRQMILKNRYDFKAHMGLAEVYSTGLNQPEKAIDVLSGAANLTNDYYVETYGKAYAVVLNETDVPEEHFTIYLLRARLLKTLGRHEEVIRDCKWGARVRPKDHRCFYLLGESFLAIGKYGEACAAFKKASDLGHLPSSNRFNQICMQ